MTFRSKLSVVSLSALLGVLLLLAGKDTATAEVKAPRKASWRLVRKLSGLRLSSEDVPVFSADGKTLAVLDGAAPAIQIRDGRTGELRKTLAVNKMYSLTSGLALSADGGTVAVRGATFHGYFAANAIKVIEIASGKEVLQFANEPGCRKELAGCYPDLLALSPDGRRLAWSSAGGFSLFYVWDRDTNTIRQCPSPLPHSWRATHLTFSPDGKTLACGVWGIWSDGYSRECFYEAATGKEMGRSETGVWQVQWVIFTPDGKSVVLVGETGDPVNARQTRTMVNTLDMKPFRLIGQHVVGTNVIAANQSIAVGPRISCSRDATTWCLSYPTEVVVWDRLTNKKEVILRDLPATADSKAIIAPDGRTVVVSYPRQGILSLWRCNATSTSGK